MARRKRSQAKRMTALERRILKEEKKIEKEEQRVEGDEKRLSKEEKKIEKTEGKILFTLGRFKFKRKHAFDFAKIAAGALLGTGLGLGFISGKVSLAQSLAWWQVIAVTLLALGLAALLVWKEEKDTIEKQKHPQLFIAKRVATIYIIALVLVTVVSMLLTAQIPDIATMTKVLLIGSFSAVSGAITFHLL